MGRRNDIDWEAIETDFRVSQLSVRQIAEKHGTEASSISRRAKKDGWDRDLSQAVAVATKTKVRNAVINATQHNATECTQATFDAVDLAANVNATIILGQQKRVGRLSGLFEKITGELEAVMDDPETLTAIADKIEEEDPKAAESIKRLKSMTSRMNNLKTATEIMGKLNDSENSAFSITEGKTANATEDFLDVLRKEEGL